MRVVIRKKVNDAPAITLMDINDASSDQSSVRTHYESMKTGILAMLSREMDAVFDSPEGNLLDVLVSKKNV